MCMSTYIQLLFIPQTVSLNWTFVESPQKQAVSIEVYLSATKGQHLPTSIRISFIRQVGLHKHGIYCARKVDTINI